MQKFKFLTFGCKANKYDSALLESLLLKSKDLTVSQNGQVPDFIVINTCTVTESSDSQARQMIRSLKRKYPSSKVFVTGCYARINPEDIKKRTDCDQIISIADPNEIIKIIKKNVDIDETLIAQEKAKFIDKFGGHTRAFLKIQDGCDSFCTYCIIPYARGKPRSIPSEDVLEQIKIFSKNGYKEIVLTGIHLGIYGKDRAEKNALLNLLRRIEKEKTVQRIRLSSIEPDEIDTDMISFLASSKVVNHHIHLPLQSASNKILALMGRKYTKEYFSEKVSEIKSSIKTCGLGVDIIAGFPGESESDFRETFDLIKNLPVTYLHVFPFSARAGTRAFGFGGKVNTKVIKERCAKLRLLGSEKKNEFMKSLLGSVQSVLIESKSDADTGYAKGFSKNYVQVVLRDKSADEYSNSLVDVLLERIEKERVFAKLL